MAGDAGQPGVDDQTPASSPRDIRSDKLGNDPFTIVVVLISGVDALQVQPIAYSGADDALLLPFSPEVLGNKLAVLAGPRRPFIVRELTARLGNPDQVEAVNRLLAHAKAIRAARNAALPGALEGLHAAAKGVAAMLPSPL